MQAFGIFPAFEPQEDEKTSAALDMIVDILVPCLFRDDEISLYSVIHEYPEHSPEEDQGMSSDVVATLHLIKHETEDALRAWLRKSIDPFLGDGCDVRSTSTCRYVRIGFDGQAFLLLPTEDDPPVSPDETLVVIEDMSKSISETDWFDG